MQFFAYAHILIYMRIANIFRASVWTINSTFEVGKLGTFPQTETCLQYPCQVKRVIFHIILASIRFLTIEASLKGEGNFKVRVTQYQITKVIFLSILHHIVIYLFIILLSVPCIIIKIPFCTSFYI